MSIIKDLTNVGGMFLAFSKCILLAVSEADKLEGGNEGWRAIHSS